jgi:hypothetical protein
MVIMAAILICGEWGKGAGMRREASAAACGTDGRKWLGHEDFHDQWQLVS